MTEAKTKAPPAVLGAIAAVMEEIGKTGIAKDRDNQQQKYKFRGIDDVYNAIAPLLAKHKLIILPEVMSREKTERTTDRGTVLFYVAVQVKFRLVCSIDGSEIIVTMPGEAMDAGDKATNKAMSAAYKYMAMQTFCIPTEGDNDADATTHEPVKAKEAPPPRTARSSQQEPLGATDDDAGRAQSMIDGINGAKTNAGVDDAVKKGVQFLHSLKDRNPRLYDRIQDAARARRAQIAADAEFDNQPPARNGHDFGFADDDYERELIP